MARKSKSSKKYTTVAKVKKLKSKSSKRSVKRSNKRSTKKSKSKSKGKMTWFGAVAKARKELGVKGFVAINKGPEGKKLYNKAKEIYGK
tara:strand:- start:1322 stop:1588 length:267 start_codon:yes stop_codon:yes gene_type:complete